MWYRFIKKKKAIYLKVLQVRFITANYTYTPSCICYLRSSSSTEYTYYRCMYIGTEHLVIISYVGISFLNSISLIFCEFKCTYYIDFIYCTVLIIIYHVPN